MLKTLFFIASGIAAIILLRAASRMQSGGVHPWSDGLMVLTALAVIAFLALGYFAFRARLASVARHLGPAGLARVMMGVAGGAAFFGLVLLLQSDRYDQSRTVALWLCGGASLLGAWGWIVRPK